MAVIPQSVAPRNSLPRLPKHSQATNAGKVKACGRTRSHAASRALQALKEVLQCMEVMARRDAIVALKPRVRTALLGFMAHAHGDSLSSKRRATSPGTREIGFCNRSSLWTLQRCNVRKFKGRIYFGSMCLTTKEQDDRERASQNQAILERIRDAVASECAANPRIWEDEDALLLICSQVLEANCTSEASLGLSASVTLRATQWLGETRIVTPASNLRVAFRTRRRLFRARATSWQSFRAEWVALLHRLENKSRCSLQRAEAIVDIARCKALKRQLSHATGAVERTLLPMSRRSYEKDRSKPASSQQVVAASESALEAKRCRPGLDFG